MVKSSLNVKLANIKLLALDVDGVLTDGKVCLLPSGEEIKFFHIHDGYGMNQIKQAGIEIVIITGRHSTALEARMSELNINFIYQGCGDKLAALQDICQRLDIPLQAVAYVGDDIPDYAVMSAAGVKLSVANAVKEIKAIADYCTESPGGQGAVREVCDLLLSARESNVDSNVATHIP